jgi:hypothetical protein
MGSENMELFEDKIIEEYIIWQEANPKNFSWGIM